MCKFHVVQWKSEQTVRSTSSERLLCTGVQRPPQLKKVYTGKLKTQRVDMSPESVGDPEVRLSRIGIWVLQG